jgi:hypothetical protein
MTAYFGHDVDRHVDMLANSEGRWELTITNKLCFPKVQPWGGKAACLYNLANSELA